MACINTTWGLLPVSVEPLRLYPYQGDKHPYLSHRASVLANSKTVSPWAMFSELIFQVSESDFIKTSSFSVCRDQIAGLMLAHQWARVLHPGFVFHMVPRSFICLILCQTTTVWAQLLINSWWFVFLLMYAVPLQPGTPAGKHISYLYLFAFYLHSI